MTTTHHDGHDGHDKHAGHDPEMFRRLFWWNLLLAVPVLVFSEQIQDWFDYSLDGAWTAWVAPVLLATQPPPGVAVTGRVWNKGTGPVPRRTVM